MQHNTREAEPICVNKQPIETVTQFVYIVNKAGVSMKWLRRGDKKTENCLKRKNERHQEVRRLYSNKTKIPIIDSSVKSVVLCGCEIWKRQTLLTGTSPYFHFLKEHGSKNQLVRCV